jgi:hypothetical protein
MITWTTSCYEPIADLSIVSSETIMERKNLSQISSDPRYTPTQMGPTEMAQFTTKEVAERLGPLFVSWNVSMSNTRRAMIDTRGTWHNVKVTVTWSDMTFWTVLWATKAVSDLFTSPEQKGQRREVRFVPLVNARSWVCLTIGNVLRGANRCRTSSSIWTIQSACCGSLWNRAVESDSGYFASHLCPVHRGFACIYLWYDASSKLLLLDYDKLETTHLI